MLVVRAVLLGYKLHKHYEAMRPMDFEDKFMAMVASGEIFVDQDVTLDGSNGAGVSRALIVIHCDGQLPWSRSVGFAAHAPH